MRKHEQTPKSNVVVFRHFAPPRENAKRRFNPFILWQLISSSSLSTWNIPLHSITKPYQNSIPLKKANVLETFPTTVAHPNKKSEPWLISEEDPSPLPLWKSLESICQPKQTTRATCAIEKQANVRTNLTQSVPYRFEANVAIMIM